MFNPEGIALSAFEISYPKADKEALDGLVARIERSLSVPRMDR